MDTAADPHVVQVRRLHKKTSKEDLQAFAAPFGAVARINIFYGWGQGIVEMENAGAAAALLAAYADAPPRVRGKEVVLSSGVAARADQIFKQSPANPAYVQKEVARCVCDMLKVVEVKEIRRAANELRAKHNALIREYTRELEASGRQRNDVCWEWITTGLCPQEQNGEACPYAHQLVPVCDLPARYRWWLRKDTFPAQREVGPYKKAM